MDLKGIRGLVELIKSNISKVIIGKDDAIDLILVALFCSGHILLEDVPGVGKTMLAKCLAKSINCDFKRIQFTPDLLPSDVTGINFYSQRESEFVFRPGPVFSNIILADEINRATPRTQASLLECMEEGQVTIDGYTRVLLKPFMVIATQNPVETQGTFPLPEAQLDRFFIKIKLGYPSKLESKAILDRFQESSPFSELTCVADTKDIINIQNQFSSVKVNDAIKEYIVDIVDATKTNDRVSLGVSPRGALALMRASQAMAVLKGRQFVLPDDVKLTAVPVLAHRLILKGHSMNIGSVSPEAIITGVLEKVPVPVEAINI